VKSCPNAKPAGVPPAEAGSEIGEIGYPALKRWALICRPVKRDGSAELEAGVGVVRRWRPKEGAASAQDDRGRVFQVFFGRKHGHRSGAG